MTPRMRPRRILAALLAVTSVAVALTGCGIRGDQQDSATPPGTELRVIEVDGVDRSYRVHIPEQLATDPALVVMMHGGLGSAQQAERAYGWNAESDAAGFVVAYPDGKSRTWNAGDCCGGAERDDVNDVAFITALVGELQNEFGISSDRTFATGMSNGAMMSYRLACETDLFAAIAPVAGTIVTPCEAPAPTSVLHIHGLDDGSVRMDGEPGNGIGDVDGMPIADVNALWRAAGACADPVITDEPPVTTSASACADDRRVVLVTVADAGHQWPGSVAREGATDQPSGALDATALIWEFFDAA
ncbi:PHB depolymerase family esterase [Pseudolysinimonas sp.]|uniref:extracellular catalytic domain type 1 short-chain-length polyhydroxyalkanoate depolymerase n=1 Tax=Pseudolysinimonas sp. TaxID=2680009 RepID=UPI00286B96FF|nr:PHB depolymerase family esterase [Pseudolysinimonas sp.]